MEQRDLPAMMQHVRRGYKEIATKPGRNKNRAEVLMKEKLIEKKSCSPKIAQFVTLLLFTSSTFPGLACTCIFSFNLFFFPPRGTQANLYSFQLKDYCLKDPNNEVSIKKKFLRDPHMRLHLSHISNV